MSVESMASLKIGGAIRYLEALESFTKGDLIRVKKLVPLWMEEYNKEKSRGANSDSVIIGSTPLHLAVQCAKKEVVATILDIDNPRVPIDAFDTQGMTALHCAAKVSRKDIVKLLLHYGADDMLLNAQGFDSLALASDPGVIEVIQNHRSEVARKMTTRLFYLIATEDELAVKEMLNNPSTSSRIKLTARDIDTGGTLLHLAVQHSNVELAKWAVAQGVNICTKDNKGYTAADYAKGDNIMSELLNQSSKETSHSDDLEKAPNFSGKLHKWTNYASGWKSRWFELKNGVLSYYKDKDNADISCRGSINLRIARINLIKEGSQFEVHGKGSIKYRLKANDSTTAKQWVHLLNQSKEWALKNCRSSTISAESPSTAFVADTDADDLIYALPTVNKAVSKNALQVPKPTNSPRATRSTSFNYSVDVPAVTIYRTYSSQSSQDPQQGNIDVKTQNRTPRVSISDKYPTDPRSARDTDPKDEEDEDDDKLYMARDGFNYALSKLKAQLFIQNQLLASVPSVRSVHSASGSSKNEKEQVIERLCDVATRSTSQINSLISDLESSYNATNSTWKSKLRSEQERINMLADDLRTAVVSSQNRAKSIQQQIKGTKYDTRDSTILDTGFPELHVVNNIESSSEDDTISADDNDHDNDSEFSDSTEGSIKYGLQDSTKQKLFNKSGSRIITGKPAAVPEMISRKATATSLVSAKSHPEVTVIEGATDMTALSGYPLPVHLRTSLPKFETGGPSLNLWSVIKGAIGKDLSRISMPVFFNEPTSFLQRLAEDMEYCELLEIASLLPHSEDRTLFVAGFAMSNYASSFGRIAKPFNPLLGETFEYVRRDKKYRAISEQVEHHPPISACWVEGRNYMYHADTNLKSKFNGGSLTVTPIGSCHVTLKLPLSFLDNEHEKSAGKAIQELEINEEEGYFTEHYTWDKLTSNVNGIMIASLWIEHFGDLNVVNHRTGDKTLISFLQSNWMGKNKFKVVGEAHNRRGDKVYDISGDWRKRLVARPVNRVESDPATDYDMAEDISPPADIDEVGGSNTADAVEYAERNPITIPNKTFVLWDVNERPKDAAYHLTSFAMTLNDKPTELDPYLCPTDSRFRPDQRAMETGDYDLADAEKSRLENKQRATRRRREQGDLPSWRPRWFVKDVDPDSGESYWKFTGEYWTERENAAQKQKEAGASQPASADVWENVEDIF